MNEKMYVYLDENAIMPVRCHAMDAGMDLMTPVDFVVKAGSYAFIDTGVHIDLPEGTCGHVCSKSGLNRYHGITADGTIDEGYTGSIGVILHNSDTRNCLFKRGDKIAQVVIEKIVRPDLVLVDRIRSRQSERGDNGFGSTGR